MHYYKVFGYIFRCEYEIPQLYKINPTDEYDVDIFIGQMPDEILEAVKKEIDFPCIGWDKDYFWLHNDYGIFAIYDAGKIYAKSPSLENELYLLQFVMGYGIALYAHIHNRIAIHCGCVAIDNKCLLISGDSGAGKSTLTHELIASGATMLSDDIAAIGYHNDNIPLVFPAFPQQKLCRDAALKKGYNLDELVYIDPEKDKFAVIQTDNFCSNPVPLHTIIYMECYEPTKKDEPAKLQITKLEGFQKVATVINNLYLGSLIATLGLSAESFQLCVDLIKDCQVYRIRRPMGQNTLPEIKEFIYSSLKN